MDEDEPPVEEDTSPDEVELTLPLEVDEPPVDVEVEPPDEEEFDDDISMLMPLEPLLVPELELLPPKNPPAKKPPMKPPPPEPPITPEDEPLLLDETTGISPLEP